MKNFELPVVLEMLKNIPKELVLPMSIRYAINKSKVKLSESIKSVEDVRIELLDSCSEKDEAGNWVLIEEDGKPTENRKIKESEKERWEKGFNELMEMESDVALHKIKLEDLKGLEVDGFVGDALFLISE